jgi:hypothetical protein
VAELVETPMWIGVSGCAWAEDRKPDSKTATNDKLTLRLAWFILAVCSHEAHEIHELFG